MVSEVDTRRNQIRELGRQMKKGDRAEIEASLEEPAKYIKEVIKKRVKEMQELGCFPTEKVYDGEFQRISGASLSSGGYDWRREYPFLYEDGQLYMCRGKKLDLLGRIDWQSKREATAREHIEYAPSILGRLAEAIDYHLNPIDPYFMD